jgi:hypothetical protein
LLGHNKFLTKKEGSSMNSRVEAMANEAVFQLQFNTREAVRYVQRNAGADEKTAQAAIKAVTTFHKHH